MVPAGHPRYRSGARVCRRGAGAMGPLSRREKSLVAIMLAVMAGWVTSPWHGIPTRSSRWPASAILLVRVLAWDDLLDEKKPGTR